MLLLTTNINISMSWTSIKQKFRIKDNGLIYVTWNNNKS